MKNIWLIGLQMNKIFRWQMDTEYGFESNKYFVPYLHDLPDQVGQNWRRILETLSPQPDQPALTHPQHGLDLLGGGRQVVH